MKNGLLVLSVLMVVGATVQAQINSGLDDTSGSSVPQAQGQTPQHLVGQNGGTPAVTDQNQGQVPVNQPQPTVPPTGRPVVQQDGQGQQQLQEENFPPPAGVTAIGQNFRAARTPTIEELLAIKTAPLRCYRTDDAKTWTEVPAIMHSISAEFPVVINDPTWEQQQNQQPLQANFAFQLTRNQLETNQRAYAQAVQNRQLIADQGFNADFLGDTDKAIRATYHYATQNNQQQQQQWTEPSFKAAVKTMTINGKNEVFVKMQVDGGEGNITMVVNGRLVRRPPILIYLCTSVAKGTAQGQGQARTQPPVTTQVPVQGSNQNGNQTPRPIPPPARPTR